MISVGIVSIIPALGQLDQKMLYVLSKLMLIALGAIIILDPKKSVMRGVGMYALALGGGRALRSLEGLISPNDFEFLFSLFMLALGINLAICGITYFNHTSKNARRMTLTTYMIFMAYLLEIIYSIFLGADPLQLLMSKYDTVALLVMYALYIAILNTREIRYNIPLERVLMDMDGIGHVSGIPKDATLSESDLELIREGLSEKPSWDILDSGPAGWETKIVMGGRSSGTIILTKMKESGAVVATLVTNPDGTFLQGTRFKIVSVSSDGGDQALIRGENGLFMKIRIRREESA